MVRLREAVAMLALGVMLALSLPASAQTDMGGGGMAGGGHMPAMTGERCPNCPSPMAERPKWLSSMTDEQRAKMDAMHLKLGREMSLLDARLELKEAELKNLVTQDAPDKKAVRQKIDEIIELKKEMMTKKYDHVMELRGILTPEQRTSFDMMFLGGMRHMMGAGRGMEHGMGGMGGGMGR